MEETKHKSRKHDSEKKDEDSKRSHRDRDHRERKERHREKEKDRERKDSESRRSERERSSDSDDMYEQERERDKDKPREKDKDRVRSRDSEKERAREKKREKERDRERELKEREKEKEKEKRAREKEREREKEKEREREREREKKEKKEKRERERDRDKEKERDRRARKHERHREYDSEYSEDDARESSRKRRKRDDDDSDREERTHEHRRSKSKKHKDETEDSPKKKIEDVESEKKLTKEEELVDEQARLDEEMEKRRRRVQEWQLSRKKEEEEREKHVKESVEDAKSRKTWTLDGESDDDEAPHAENSDADMATDDDPKPVKESADPMLVDSEGGGAAPVPESKENGAVEEEIDPLDAYMNESVLPVVNQLNNGGGGGGGEEIDPLDAYMNESVLPEVNKLNNELPTPTAAENLDLAKTSKKADKGKGKPSRNVPKKSMGRIMQGEDSESDYSDVDDDGDPLEDENDEDFMKRVKKSKAEKLSIVDHSKIKYEPFRKNFYIEVKDISRMTADEVAAYRRELELKIHGKDVPRPIKTWHQTGLTSKILEQIRKLNFEKPMPIQAQALPIIMSGRDCIGIGKTGSGKTLAFVLPMLRHIKDQPPVEAGEGPIALVMAPTRELVQQIHSDIKKFATKAGVRCVPVYGGSGVAHQIGELKKGTEIVVCTPGRMIDILCTSGGKITNLRRVTYFVMDEADRMFDMGFEPQITRIVQNIRPDRQTVLFSATFPRQVEILARKVLNKPVEIQVGGRSVVNKDIAQLVEVRPESERFFRLLELLGEWYEKGKILVFVHTQDKCDDLFKDLLRHGYPCLSLHGAKDQTDRESTIHDFKNNVCNLLVATSIAARGLDVKELELVVNFDVPNHYEDYVHRVGRTGRAGRKGCAITFISEEESRYAPDLVKALVLSEQVVPDDLKALSDAFMAKVNQGLEQIHGTGYGGSGFKFNEEEDEVRKAAKKAQAKEYGFEEDKSDSDDDEGVRKAGGDISQQAAMQLAALTAASNAIPTPTVMMTTPQLPISLPNGAATSATLPLPILPADGAARAAAIAAAINLQHNLAKIQADAMPEHYEAELEINDFPQNARWKVTHKETLGPISDWTGAAITTRGQFFPPGKIPSSGERKLFLFIEGPTEQSVKRAKADLKRVLEEVTNSAFSLPGGNQPGKYSVI